MKAHSAVLIGLLAGIAGGLMALAGFEAGTLALLLLFAAPSVVYIASLGWGTAAGLVAAVVATAISAYDASSLDGTLVTAVATGTLLFLPAAWAGHLANLARPDPSGSGLVWYPLSGVLLRLMAALAVGFLATGWAAGFSTEKLAGRLVEVMNEFAAARPQGAPPAEIDIAASARLYAGLIPLVMPAVWLLLHVLVFSVAAAVARRSGRLARPAEDIAATANLPAAAIALPVVGMAGMLLAPEPLYGMSAVLAGIGIAGFGLVGLAELHHSSRGKPGRGIMLFFSYLLLVLFSLPLFIFALIGARRSLRVAAAGAGGQGPTV